MQTFLPLPTLVDSVAVLDRKRLGKQRVETLQIMRALTGASSGWRNHPAVRMWRGYEPMLLRYQILTCRRWALMGYQDTCLEKTLELVGNDVPATAPPWFGDEMFHLSHRSNLVRKMPEHYGPLWPDVPDDMPYVWPA